LDYSNFEVVLVDDGSTQPAAIQALQELEPAFAQLGWKIVCQQNRYLGAARNTAVRNATGDFLLFMDDDNFADPAELSTLVKAALHSNADIVTCGTNFFSGTEPPNSQAAPKRRWLPLGAAVPVGAFRNCFGDANALVRRSCFERLGGFTEVHGVTHEDWEFHAKAVLQGFKLTVVPEFLFWYRVSEDSMMRTTSDYQNTMLSIQPYLDAVPEALRNFVLFAQGQHLRLSKSICPAPSAPPPPIETPLIIAWRSKLEVARVFAREKRTDMAVRFLIEAVKSVEHSRNPLIVLDALLTVGAEMRALDAASAAHLLQLAATLADGFKNEAGRQAATNLLASLPDRPVVPTKEPPAPSECQPIWRPPMNISTDTRKMAAGAVTSPI
jgi:hypothetical protein